MHKSLPALLLLAAACFDEPAVEPDAPADGGAPDAAAPAAPAVPQVTGDEPSLLLITMDTTRLDRLGAYGYTKAVTPHVDQAAQQGVRFDRAYAVVPLTTPAHSSMMTGLYPTRHGIHTNGDAILSEDLTTLAEMLQERGWHTAGSISAFVTTRIWNLDQGFDDYFDQVTASADSRDDRWGRERRAGAVVDDLEGWFAAKPDGEPFFAWAHFYDPHDPYDPPEPWDDDARTKGRPYDGEIAYMDEQIGRLTALAERDAGPGGVAVILVADHGEGLGDHGEELHGMYIYDPTMRIPFIVKPAKPLEAPVVVDDVAVSNVDVMPTALGLLGLQAPDGIDGHDLSGFAASQKVERDPVYLESETPFSRFGFHPEWAAAEGDWKLFDTPNPRLFNVAKDPGETKNLIGENADVAKELTAFVEGIQAARSEAEDFSASPEMIEQLAALGYVAGADEGPMDLTGTLDAKDQDELIGRVEDARRMSNNPKTVAKAEASLRKILEEQPQMGELRLSLSRVLQRQGKLQQAEAVLREGVELQPQSTVIRSNLAGILGRQGRFQEAYELAQTIHEQVPGDDLARFAMLRYLRGMEKADEALALGLGWLAGSPENHGLQALVGELDVLHGDAARGAELLTKSLADDMPRSNVHRTLALVAFANKDFEVAREHLEKEANWFPANPQVRLELGNTLMKLERWDDAAAEYAMLTRMRPQVSAPRRLWAQAVFNAGNYAEAGEILAPALEAHPDDSYVLLLQANVLEKLGETEKAKAVFEEAKRLHQAQREAVEQSEEALPGMELYKDRDDGLPDVDDL